MKYDPRYVLARLLRKARPNAVQGSEVDPTAKLESGTTFVGSTIGRHSFCGYDCTIAETDIGAFCSIASNVTIGLAGRHPLHYVSTSPVFLSHRDSVRTKYARHVFDVEGRTRIGNDVWIGQGAYIAHGVSIGDGAVVGMASVVTKDVEPYAIVVGNPARTIRSRFDPDVVEGLLQLRWWDWDDARLERRGDDFVDPKRLLGGQSQ